MLLSVENVTKRYGDLVAVDHVSFTARPGRILGLLGPNGAGKTSTIRMIAYITVPDAGRVLLDGRPVGPWSQQRMGYLPEERGLYKKMKVGEQLLYLAELKGLTRAGARDRIRYWLDRFGARDWENRKTETLSKGMQQKIQFIATILHDPDLVILDEPFGGLDPINADLLQEVILELKEKGRTILFASHRMEQVEQLCDDICLISKGAIVLQGPLREVKRRFGRDTVLLDFEGDDAFLDRLVAEGCVRINVRSRNHAELRLLDGTPPRRVLEAAMASVDEVSRFEVVEPPMREIFVSVVTRQQGAAEARAVAVDPLAGGEA
ncbi:ABC transporter ATP-binding protein [Rhodocaloribacter litoris]|uniref:ABC transporter ATP-binding protein n=1 Tax=Rhodocaloribacter litoris TaxID=2558931 RepID=UPI001E604343|nr:ATP-binding cassette domain-containing protein [Rhodocaloribacter litoris]